MSDWSPGDGWVEAPRDVPKSTPNIRVTDEDGVVRWYVRPAPVPALPTEPYTVIRVWWGTAASTDIWLTDEGQWVSRNGFVYTTAELSDRIRFEVLSEPRNSPSLIAAAAIRPQDREGRP